MLRYLCAVMILLGTFLAAACGTPPVAQQARTLVVYSELDKEFTGHLLEEYNKQKQQGTQLQAVYELKPDAAPPDLVLADASALQQLKSRQFLQPVSCLAGDSIPVACRDAEEYWYGAFYDPVVFLINQQYARKVGQQQLQAWADLPKRAELRIVIQNLTNSGATKEFLAAMASHLGEKTALSYLLQLSPAIIQYAKFPFTPVRMTAVGDADLAITRQSFVFKYLDNNFPAYLVLPREGTPIDLYGAAVCKSCRYPQEGAAFIDWLISSDGVKRISQIDNTGFLFLLPQGLKGNAADGRLLWLNSRYLQESAREALLGKWLETVRFSNGWTAGGAGA